MLLYNAASNRCLLRSVYNNRATFKYLATQTTARNCFDSGTRFRASNIFRSSPNQVRCVLVIYPLLMSRYFGSKAPLSPDVRIYKFPLPAITSIMNRVTSTSLAIGLYFERRAWDSLGFFAASILVIVNPAYITTIVGFVKTYPQLHYLLKLCLSYAITYHYISGVRRFVSPLWNSFANHGVVLGFHRGRPQHD